MSEGQIPAAAKRLDSWKEIAEYLGCDVRTAMRWEQEADLPIRRVPGGGRRAVFAITEELDGWRHPSTTEPVGPTVLKKQPWIVWSAVTLGVLILLLATVANRGLFPGSAQRLEFKLPNRTLRFIGTSRNIDEGGMGNALAEDLNKDGYPDIVVGGAPTGKIAVFWNQMDGTFSAPLYLSGCRGSIGPSAADYDGDGNIDIAIGCKEKNLVEVWWGDGHGNFQSPIRIREIGVSLRISSADLNGDGYADIVAGGFEGGPLSILFGSKNRTFQVRKLTTAGPVATVIDDFNRDGLPDIAEICAPITCHQIAILLNKGGAEFAPPIKYNIASASWYLFQGDANGDAIPDLITTASTGEIELFLGRGDGTFEPARQIYQGDAPLVLPMAGEGEPLFLIFESWKGDIRIMQVKPGGKLDFSPPVFVTENIRAGAVADFNRDGLLDFAFPSYASGTAKLNVYLQQPPK